MVQGQFHEIWPLRLNNIKHVTDNPMHGFSGICNIFVWHLVLTNFRPEVSACPWTNIYLLVWQYFGLVEWRYLDHRLLVEHRLGSAKYLRAKISFKNRPIRNEFSFEPIKNDQFWPMAVKKWSILNYKSIFLKST